MTLLHTQDLKDNQHRRFQATLEDEDGYFVLYLTRQNKMAGDVRFSIDESGMMTLDTIMIVNRSLLRDRFICAFTGKYAGFTRNGLGYRALELALRLAKDRGATSVCGYISRPNLGQDPGLIDWYKRQGFDVELADADTPIVAAYLFRSL